jgi:putative hydrolase
VAVNVSEAFAGWELDPREVAVILALHEAAHRRLFHAVPWLEAHLQGLVASFANGTRVDAEQLRDLADELMLGIDPEDPEQLQEAMGRAANFRLRPTPEQERILDRIQGVVCLVQAWVRAEVGRAAAGRLTSLDRVDEILRRRRATKGDGEELLEQLLGLDLKPEDETVGDRFVATVTAGQGSASLRDALAHPENLPDREELEDPSRWLVRMAASEAVPDDLSELFGDLGEAPVEGSAAERAAEHGPDDQNSAGGADDDAGGDESDDGSDGSGT